MIGWDWWPPENLQEAAEWAHDRDVEALGERFNRRILGDDRWEELPERTRQLLRAEGEAFRADMLSQESPPFDIDDLTVPRLVGCGTVPHFPVTTSTWQLTAAKIGCELRVIEGANHWAYLSQPDAWVRFVREAINLGNHAKRAS